jgi:hypothetical protein
MSARKIIYKDGSWFPMLNHIGDLLGKLSAPELRMYIALCIRGRGRARHLAFSNVELMKKARLNKDSLPIAREGLVKHELIRVTVEEKRKETYEYEILSPTVPITLNQADETPGNQEVLTAVPIPHDVLFRPSW